MKITIRCDECDTILREKDGPTLDITDITVKPCPQCTSDLSEELLQLRRQKAGALDEARSARNHAIDHRVVLQSTLDLAARCIALQVPPYVHDDIPS